MTRLALLVLAGCGGGQQSAPASSVPPPSVAPPAALEVSIQVIRDTGVPIKAKDTLPTRSDFAVIVTLSSSAHVYVGGLDASHKSYSLFPKAQVSAEIPAGPHRIPDSVTKWLVLEPPAGPEVLFVIASRRPIADVDESLAVAVGELPPAETTTPSAPSVATRATPTTTSPLAASPRASAAKKPPRNVPGFTPDPNRLAGLTPRGTLKARSIGEEDRGPIVVSDHDGVVIYLLSFTQVPATP